MSSYQAGCYSVANNAAFYSQKGMPTLAVIAWQMKWVLMT